MKLIEDTPTRLAFTLGAPWFNGTRCEMDKTTGLATIETTNLFWKSKLPTFRLDEIAAVDLMTMSGPRVPGKPVTKAAYPRLTLSTGQEISLPSFGTKSAEDAVDKMMAFLSP